MTPRIAGTDVSIIEITYKFKRPDRERNNRVSSRLRLELRDVTARMFKNKWRLNTIIEAELDNEHFYLECEFVARADLDGIEGSTIDDQRAFVETCLDDIKPLVLDGFRIKVNEYLNDLLSKTVTPPQGQVEFWQLGE